MSKREGRGQERSRARGVNSAPAPAQPPLSGSSWAGEGGGERVVSWFWRQTERGREGERVEDGRGREWRMGGRERERMEESRQTDRDHPYKKVYLQN